MPARVDSNQPEIVAALRKAGATVQHLHMVGKGCPDLLVGFRGRNFLLEIKSPGGRMTPAEQRFFDEWSGQVSIVCTIEQALAAIGAAEYVT